MGISFRGHVDFTRDVEWEEICAACGGSAPREYTEPRGWTFNFTGSSSYHNVLEGLKVLGAKGLIEGGRFVSDEDPDSDILPDGSLCPVVIIRVRLKPPE